MKQNITGCKTSKSKSPDRPALLLRKFLIVSLAVFVAAMLLTGLAGCFKVYPEPEQIVQENNFEGEEPPPGEPQPEGEPPHEEQPPEEPPHEEEPPGDVQPGQEPKTEEPKQEEPKKEEPKTAQPKISEQEIKKRCFNAAQYQIENNSIYKNVVFATKFDENFMNKVTGFDYKYECGIEFNALDTNVNKNGWFVWTFVVSYDVQANNCYVETGAMQTEKYN
jgi:hypothetical protein